MEAIKRKIRITKMSRNCKNFRAYTAFKVNLSFRTIWKSIKCVFAYRLHKIQPQLAFYSAYLDDNSHEQSPVLLSSSVPHSFSVLTTTLLFINSYISITLRMRRINSYISISTTHHGR